MSESACAKCRKLLSDNEDNEKLADLVEAEHPRCACESHSIGDGSPGAVRNNELLHRLIVSPRDYDPETRTIRAKQFEKVFANGLSVWRAAGPEADVEILLSEALTRSASSPTKEVFGVCETDVATVRRMVDADGGRLFCVYDHTVRRQDGISPPVATHASIFLRLPPPKTEGRTRLRKDYAGLLRENFLRSTIPAADYKNGLCVRLNERAAAGEFVDG